MRLLWVAVLRYNCSAVILLAVWRAACWSHFGEGPVACQQLWSEWEGNNVYCYIFCFLFLYVSLSSLALIFFLSRLLQFNVPSLAYFILALNGFHFQLSMLLSFPCVLFSKYLLLYQPYIDGLPLFSASPSHVTAEWPASPDTACPLLLLCVRVISKNLMTL